MKKSAVIYACLSASLLSSNLLNAAMPGPYLGVGAGIVSMDNPSDAYTESDTNFGGRAFLGYNLNTYIGFEASYAALGDNTYRTTRCCNNGIDISMSAVSLLAKGYLPLGSEAFNLYAALGGAQTHAEYQIHNSRSPILVEKGLVGTGGIGASYDLNKNLVASLDLSYFAELEHNNVIEVPAATMATLNLAYKFN